MVELSSRGNNLTWGGKIWKKWIQCALDISFGNKEWHKLFPASNQTFLDKRGSEHRPVWMNFYATHQTFKGQFRFDKKIPDATKCQVRSEHCLGAEHKWTKSIYHAEDTNL